MISLVRAAVYLAATFLIVRDERQRNEDLPQRRVLGSQSHATVHYARTSRRWVRQSPST